MNLTTAEILELEELLNDRTIRRLKKGLTEFDENTNPNYKLLYDAITSQEWGSDEKGNPILTQGKRGCILEGSSRSGKTWSGIDIIIWLCTIKHKSESVTINIYRETYNEFKTTLYDDFKRRLDDFGLDNPFNRVKEIKSFKIGKSTIYFLGDGKHGGGCDYAFYNEMMMIENSVFDQSEMRCRKFWWGDYNPSFTDHWVFDKVVLRDDVGFLRTTFLDNPFISPQEKSKILGYEPWETGSYEVDNDGVYYNGNPIDNNNHPPPNSKNQRNGTADVFMWKVYGLGLRGAMKGVIFNNVTYIDKFPDIAHTYANDFGFTADPNALVKYAEDDKNIYIEPLIYEPIETPEALDAKFKIVGVEKRLPITCDSSDKYTGENKGTVEMVAGLKKLKWLAFKVHKIKSVMYWILSMKKKKLHVVINEIKNKDGQLLWKCAKKEAENYKFKEVNGIMINQPIDKYNHIWDAARYGHIAYNSKPKKFQTHSIGGIY